MEKGLLIVLSGPSGVGKSTLYGELERLMPNLRRSISVTTRAPRAGEEDGVDYYFKSVEQYQEMIARGEFLERAEVYCNYYGTPKKPVFKMLDEGFDVIFVVDTYGARQIKSAYPEAVLIFVFPPSANELERRLRERNSDGEEQIARRKSAALRELIEHKNYDYFVVNDDRYKAARTVVDIISAEKCAVKRNEALIKDIVKEFKSSVGQES